MCEAVVLLGGGCWVDVAGKGVLGGGCGWMSLGRGCWVEVAGGAGWRLLGGASERRLPVEAADGGCRWRWRMEVAGVGRSKLQAGGQSYFVINQKERCNRFHFQTARNIQQARQRTEHRQSSRVKPTALTILPKHNTNTLFHATKHRIACSPTHALLGATTTVALTLTGCSTAQNILFQKQKENPKP
eukprot:364507-Chlamydomonas_euryale.AAC.4